MQNKRKVNLRMAVGTPGGLRSNVWRGSSHKNDVYLMTTGMKGIEKFSFHQTGDCRRAFLDKVGPADGETDRVIQRWWRPAPVPAGMLTQVVSLRIPSEYLSTTALTYDERKSITWIPPAPNGGATLIDFAFSGTSDSATREMAGATGRTVVSLTRLPNGDAFVVTWVHCEWPHESFTVPGLFNQPGQHVISRSDPLKTGRPVRFMRFIDPTPEWPIMTIDEFGAYPAPLDMEFSEPMGSFNPNKVLKHTKLQRENSPK
jgi:hypothetical protein